MKKLHSLLLASLVMLAGCGEINDRLDALEGRVDAIENTQIATISQQITSINNSILLLNNTDKELASYITVLEAEMEALEAKLSATNTRIDNVKMDILASISNEKANLLAELEALRNTTTARLEEINATIAELQAADGDMSAQIAALEAEAAQLSAQLAETNTKIDTVKSELTETISTEKANILAELEAFKATVNGELDAIKAVLETLKAKDVELDGKIATLQEYVDTELKATEDWATATFATLEQYNEVVATIATIEGTIEGINESIAALETRINEKIAKDIETACVTLSADLQNAVKEVTEAYTSAITTAKNELTEAYTTALEGAISALETSMKAWINEQLTGYYTISEINAKLKVLQSSIIESNAALQKEIDALESTIAKHKTEITNAYLTAISDAITNNNGVIDEKIATEISAVNEKITTLENHIQDIELRLKTLEGIVDDLLGKYLDVTFEGMDSVVINAGSYFTVGYTITSSESEVHIATIAQGGWNATITQTTGKSGYITIYAPNPLTAVPIIVLVSDANTTIMRTLTLMDEVTSIIAQCYSITAEATTLSIGVQTNLNYEVIVPPSAQSWISLQSITTRASIRNDVINLNIKENTTTRSRSAILQLVCDNVEVGTISISQQRAEIANNELIYTTTDGKPINIYQANGFTSRVISNRYINGRGVIVFNDDITNVGEYAFYNCTTLKSITMPKTINTIGSGAFQGCFNLINVVIPDSVVLIDSNAFYDCDSLTSIEIPDGISTIGDSAFANCDKLKVVSIGSGVVSLGNNAFNSVQLTALYIQRVTPPSGGNNIFLSDNLNCKIYVPIEGYRTYKLSEEWRAFISNIVAYDFNAGTEIIFQLDNEIWYTSTNGNIVEPYAMAFGANLLSNSYKDGTGVMIFDGDVSYIGGWAFSSRSTLSTISIPQSVTKIEHHAFNQCSKLKSANIPEGVTSIGNHAFNECSSFTTVVIPNTVTRISVLAFWGCPNISVYCKATTPPVGDFDMFSSVSCIYVPAESLNAYKTASYWKTYKSYIYGYDFE